MSEQAAAQAARALFDAISSGELDVLDDLLTDDFVDHAAPASVPPGREGCRMVLDFVHRVLQVRYVIDDLFAAPERVVVRATAHGVGVDAVHGPGAEGKPYAVATIHIYRTEGGRLAEHWAVRDDISALIQLGTYAGPG